MTLPFLLLLIIRKLQFEQLSSAEQLVESAGFPAR